MSIGEVTIYRCIGKVHGRIMYRISVVAFAHADAISTCKLWESEQHPPQAAQWEAQLQATTLGPLYIDTSE